MIIKEKFINLIDTYLKNLNGKNEVILKSPLEDLELQEFPSKDFLFPFLALSPEYLFYKIGLETKSLNHQVEIWNPSDKGNLREINGILSCHASSPMGDSIFLLADLGRALRASAILDKPMNVMLADKDWSKYNWVATELGTSNLLRNFQWRKDLYSKLGIKVDSCNLSNTPNKISRNEIEQIGTAYEDLVRSIFSSKYIGKKLSRKEASQLRFKYKLYSNNSDNIDFLSIPLVWNKMKTEREVIFNLRNFLFTGLS